MAQQARIDRGDGAAEPAMCFERKQAASSAAGEHTTQAVDISHGLTVNMLLPNAGPEH